MELVNSNFLGSLRFRVGDKQDRGTGSVTPELEP